MVEFSEERLSERLAFHGVEGDIQMLWKTDVWEAKISFCCSSVEGQLVFLPNPLPRGLLWLVKFHLFVLSPKSAVKEHTFLF